MLIIHLSVCFVDRRYLGVACPQCLWLLPHHSTKFLREHLHRSVVVVPRPTALGRHGVLLHRMVRGFYFLYLV